MQFTPEEVAAIMFLLAGLVVLWACGPTFLMALGLSRKRFVLKNQPARLDSPRWDTACCWRIALEQDRIFPLGQLEFAYGPYFRTRWLVFGIKDGRCIMGINPANGHALVVSASDNAILMTVDYPRRPFRSGHLRIESSPNASFADLICVHEEQAKQVFSPDERLMEPGLNSFTAAMKSYIADSQAMSLLKRQAKRLLFFQIVSLLWVVGWWTIFSLLAVQYLMLRPDVCVPAGCAVLIIFLLCYKIPSMFQPWSRWQHPVDSGQA